MRKIFLYKFAAFAILFVGCTKEQTEKPLKLVAENVGGTSKMTVNGLLSY